MTLAASAVTSGKPKPASHPACFGAASRDPAHRCVNPKLKRMVTPTPSAALLQPDAPCALIDAPVTACSFGAAAGPSTPALALVGDSHASHWRAALDVVADRLKWSGVSLTHSSCPFTQGVSTAPEPKRQECIDYNQGVIQWFDDHPEVSTMFISDHPGPVMTAPGQSHIDALVAGITSGWAALPDTVKHIIVIRDVPFIKQTTLPCVDRAIARHEDAGVACELPRATALRRDPDVLAAQQLGSPRVQVADMTNFFCSSRWCYPVIGGALVLRDDFDHMTTTFSTSLGPFLADRFTTLMSEWGSR